MGRERAGVLWMFSPHANKRERSARMRDDEKVEESCGVCWSTRIRSVPLKVLFRVCLVSFLELLLWWVYLRMGQVLGRRRRRHPSLDAFAVLAAPTETRQRADSPFVPHVTGRRPVTRSSHLATSSNMEAHV